MNGPSLMQLHIEAMKYAQEAYVAKIKGDSQMAVSLYGKAYLLEYQVAMELIGTDKEPTRSITLRSAASLALNCGKYREAEKLICFGLAGNAPEDIAQELRNLMEDVKFHRHIEQKGVRLSPHSILMSLTGDEVGYGMIESGEFLRRFQAVSNLVYRTAERAHKMPFRAKGVPSEILSNFAPYLAAPGQGSFQVQVRFGNSDPNQTQLFGDVQDQVLSEMVDCLDLVNQGKERELKGRIDNDDYYLNFVNLSKVVAPDGERIKTVTVQMNEKGMNKSVFLKKPRNQYPKFRPASDKTKIRKNKEIEATGILKVADSEVNQIRLVDEKDDKKSHYDVRVGGGMTDIVRVYFDQRVRAMLRSIGKGQYELIDLDAAE